MSSTMVCKQSVNTKLSFQDICKGTPHTPNFYSFLLVNSS